MLYKTMTAAALAVVLASPAFAQSPQGDQPKSDTMQQQSTTPKADKGATTGQSPSGGMDKSQSQSSQSGQDAGSMNQNAAKDKAGQGAASMDSADAKKQPGFLQTESNDQWRASKLMGASVLGPDDQSIGDINELLLAKDGGVEAVVVGVGGFLGIGEKNVAIPFDSLNVQRTEGNEIEKITVSFSKEELENAPKFAFAEEQARTSTTGTRPGGSPMGAQPSGPSSTQPRQ